MMTDQSTNQQKQQQNPKPQSTLDTSSAVSWLSSLCTVTALWPGRRQVSKYLGALDTLSSLLAGFNL